jgi:hypothetical protein
MWKPKGVRENAGALARFEGRGWRRRTPGTIWPAGKSSEIAAIALAIRMALGDFGKWVAALQFRQGRLDPGARFVRAVLPVDVLHDVGGMERFRHAEVFAVRLVERLNLLGGRVGYPGDHLADNALDSEVALDEFADARFIEWAAAASLSYYSPHLMLQRVLVDGPRVGGCCERNQHSIDRGTLRGLAQAAGALRLVGNGLPKQVAGDTLGLLADQLFCDDLSVDDVRHGSLGLVQ